MAFVGKAHLLRERDGKSARVSNMELFFDLIYAFAITQISHSLVSDLSLVNGLQCLVMWFGVWLAWQYTCWVTNWFDPDKISMRLMLIIIMLLGLLGATAIPHAFNNESLGWTLALSFACIQVVRNGFVLLNLGLNHSLSPNYKRIFAWGTLSAILWIVGATFLDYKMKLIFWGLATASEYFSPMLGFPTPFLGRSSTKEWTIEGGHMAERCQLFVIVALGETLLMSGATLSSSLVIDTPKIIAFITSFLSSVAMWWIYFDTSSEDGSRAIRKSTDQGKMGEYFHFVHVILIGGIILCAVASELFLATPDAPMNDNFVAILIGGPAVYLFGNILYKRIIYNHFPTSHIAGLFMLAVLIPVSYMTDLLMVGILTMVVLIIVAAWSSHVRKKVSKKGLA